MIDQRGITPSEDSIGDALKSAATATGATPLTSLDGNDNNDDGDDDDYYNKLITVIIKTTIRRRRRRNSDDNSKDLYTMGIDRKSVV